MPSIVRVSGPLYGDHGANTAVDSFNQGADHMRALEDREMQREAMAKELELSEQAIGARHRAIDLQERAFALEEAEKVATSRMQEISARGGDPYGHLNDAQKAYIQTVPEAARPMALQVAETANTEREQQERVPALLNSARRFDAISGDAESQRESLEAALTDPDPEKRITVDQAEAILAEKKRQHALDIGIDNERQKYTAWLQEIPTHSVDPYDTEKAAAMGELVGSMATAESPEEMAGILSEYGFLAVGATEAIAIEKQRSAEFERQLAEAREAVEEMSRVLNDVIGGAAMGGAKVLEAAAGGRSPSATAPRKTYGGTPDEGGLVDIDKVGAKMPPKERQGIVHDVAVATARSPQEGVDVLRALGFVPGERFMDEVEARMSDLEEHGEAGVASADRKKSKEEFEGKASTYKKRAQIAETAATRTPGASDETMDKKREYAMARLMKTGLSRTKARDMLVKAGVKFPNKGRDGLDEARAHKGGN